MALAKRTMLISGSQTAKMRNRAKQLIEEGIPIINFAAGELNLDTSALIKTAAKEAIDAGYTKYTDTLGILLLRDTLADRVSCSVGVDYRNDEISVCAGAKHALYETAMVLFDEGDEVIIPSPYWVTFPVHIMLAGATPIFLDTTTSGFQIDLAALAELITPKTKGIIINTPNNPTGVVYERTILEGIAHLAIKHDLWIIFDECYESMVYKPAQHFNIVSLVPELKSRTIVINSFSKTYAITGWRVGFAYGPRSVIEAIQRFQSHMTSNICNIAQYAALAALDPRHDTFISDIRNQLLERRDCALELIHQINDVTCHVPQGAFYIFLNVGKKISRTYKDRHLSDVDMLATLLLEECHVAVVSGSAFGANDYIRISYAISKDDILEGLNRIKHFFAHMDSH